MTILLVANPGPVTGADFEVPADSAFILSLFTEAGVFMGPRDSVSLDIKNDNGNYQFFHALSAAAPVFVLPAVGSPVTYRFRRTAASVAIGADGR